MTYPKASKRSGVSKNSALRNSGSLMKWNLRSHRTWSLYSRNTCSAFQVSFGKVVISTKVERRCRSLSRRVSSTRPTVAAADQTVWVLIYPRFYFLYVMKSRNCLGKEVFRPTPKIFLSAFPAELL